MNSLHDRLVKMYSSLQLWEKENQSITRPPAANVAASNSVSRGYSQANSSAASWVTITPVFDETAVRARTHSWNTFSQNFDACLATYEREYEALLKSIKDQKSIKKFDAAAKRKDINLCEKTLDLIQKIAREFFITYDTSFTREEAYEDPETVNPKYNPKPNTLGEILDIFERIRLVVNADSVTRCNIGTIILNTGTPHSTRQFMYNQEHDLHLRKVNSLPKVDSLELELEVLALIKEQDQKSNGFWEKESNRDNSGLIGELIGVYGHLSNHISPYSSNEKLRNEAFLDFLPLYQEFVLVGARSWDISGHFIWFFFEHYHKDKARMIKLTQDMTQCLSKKPVTASTIKPSPAAAVASAASNTAAAQTTAKATKSDDKEENFVRAFVRALIRIVDNETELEEGEKRIKALIQIYSTNPKFLKHVTRESALLLEFALKDEEAYDQLSKHFEAQGLYNLTQHFHTFASLCSNRNSYLALIRLLEFPDARKALDVLFKFGFTTDREKLRQGTLKQPFLLLRFERFLIWFEARLSKKTPSISADKVPSKDSKEMASQNAEKAVSQSHESEFKILDWVVALILEKPRTAFRLLSFSNFEIFEKIFSHKKMTDTCEATTSEVAKVLEECGVKDLAASFEHFHVDMEKRIGELNKTNDGLLKAIEAWVNLLMKTYNKESDSKETFSQKLKKLPQCYTITLEIMVLKADTSDTKLAAEILFQLVSFACQNPSNILLDRYTDQVHQFLGGLSDQNRQTKAITSLKAFTELSKALPECLPDLLSMNLDHAPACLEFLNKHRQLCLFFIKNHSWWISEKRVKDVMADRELQQSLINLCECEEANDADFFDIFWNDLSRLKHGPLLNAIIERPDVACGLVARVSELNRSHLYSHPAEAVCHLPIPSYDHWHALSTSFANRFDQTSNFVRTLYSCGDAFQGYLRRFVQRNEIDILTFAKTGSPIHVKRMVSLIRWGEKELAEKLMALHKTAPQTALNMLDMAYGGYSKEVSKLLKMFVEKPREPLTLKLLSLAGTIHAALIRKVLECVYLGDHELVHIFLNEPKEFPNLFGNLMVLRARKQETLIQRALELLRIPSEKRDPVYNAALQAIAEGRFSIAETLAKSNPVGAKFKPQMVLRTQKILEIQNDWQILKGQMDGDKAAIIEKELFAGINEVAAKCQDDKVFASWAGKVQFLLHHRPFRLIKIMQDKNWKENLNAPIWNITTYLNRAIAEKLLIEKTDKMKNAVDNETRERKELKLSMIIADLIISPSGCLNATIVDTIAALPILKLTAKNSLNSEYLLNALKIIAENADVDERLRSIIPTRDRNPQYTLLVKMFGKPIIKSRDRRVAVLSACLWPPRLGNTGQNFMVGPLIQLASSPDGFLQLLEYFISLLQNGHIDLRNHKEANIKKESSEDEDYISRLEYDRYSMTVVDNDSINNKDDHPLYRALVDTLTEAACDKKENLKTKALESLKSLLLNEIIANPPYAKFDRIGGISAHYKNGRERLGYSERDLKATSHAAGHWALYSAIIFLFETKVRMIHRDRSWLLIDSDTGNPIYIKEHFLQFYNGVLDQIKKPLLEGVSRNQHRESREFLTQHFTEYFEGRLKTFFQSREFQEDMLCENTADNVNGLLLVNPLKYYHLNQSTINRSPNGGDPQYLLSSIHGCAMRVMPNLHTRNPAEIYERYFYSLTDRELRIANKNPKYLRVVSKYSDAFNFIVRSASDMLEKETPEDNFKVQQEQYAKVRQVKLTPEMANSIYKDFVASNKNEVQPFFTRPDAMISRGTTVGELCDYLNSSFRRIRGQGYYWGFFDDVIENALRKIPGIKEMMPPVVEAYTTLFPNVMTMGYGRRILNSNVRRIFLNTDNQMDWCLGHQSSIKFYIYPDSTDALERNYSKKLD